MTTPRPISEIQYRLMKPLARLLSRAQVALYRVSGGRLGARFGGGDVCVVHMVGAKSGRKLEMPLMYVPYREGVILVASFAGGPHHPSWYYNLVAQPRIEVEWGGQRKVLVARRATGEEKAAVWPLCCRQYPDFDLYQRRTPRDIPVFICEVPAGVSHST
jgi:F420H(2)-dependent quinone reductase